jgi:hypothetical protein
MLLPHTAVNKKPILRVFWVTSIPKMGFVYLET